MAGKSAALTINVIVDALKAKMGFKSAEQGAKGLQGQISQMNAKLMGPAGAAAAFAAVGAFAMKALGDFMKLAKGAHDLGIATGLGTEQASRWIAVADDMGVAAEDIGKVFKAINKDIDNNKWQKYGIATKTAAGEARKSNDVFLDVLDVLSQIKDPTERARAGTELLGKAWGSVAPMVGKSREEYERMLASVEAGQVITAAEYQKAEQMRLAQDKLSDAWGEISLSVGEFVAGLAPAISGMAEFLTMVNIFGKGDTSEAMSELKKQMLLMKGGLWEAASGFEGLVVGSINARSDLEKSADAAIGYSDAALRAKYSQDAWNQILAEDPRLAQDLALRLQEFQRMASDPNASDGLKQQAQDMGLSKEKVDAWVLAAQAAVIENDRINAALKEQQDLVDGLTGAWEDYLGLLNVTSAADNAKNALLELTYAVDDPTTATNEFAEAQKQAATDVANFIKTAKDIPKDIQLKMLADLQSGDLAAVWKEIDDYQKEHPVTIPADVAFQSTNMKQWLQDLQSQGLRMSVANAVYGTGLEHRASGGPVLNGQTYLVGENGPELFTPSVGGSIIPNGAFSMGGGSGTMVVNVTMPAGADGAELVRALQREARRSGQIALPVSSKTVR